MGKIICIITYNKSPNYGAALQLYATYKAIEKLGHTPIVLEYDNQYEASQNKLSYLIKNREFQKIARNVVAGYLFGAITNGKDNFHQFYQNMKRTEKIYNVKELKQLLNIDVFCVGSDQVWNPDITGGCDDVFFLNVTLGKPKISYASSTGNSMLNIPIDYMKNTIGQFDKVSVREKNTKKYFEKHIGIPIYEAVDPTLLFSKKDWWEILQLDDSRIINEKYLLIYAVGGKFTQLYTIASQIAKERSLKIAVITLSNRRKPVDYLLNHITPREFVKLIGQASLVVTNSFHGTCFSIIGKTPFVSVEYASNSERAKALLEKCGLKHRLILADSFLGKEVYGVEDIVQAQECIINEVSESWEWFKGAINGVEG